MKLRGKFNTLQVLDNIDIPRSFGGTGNHLEPITNSYPQYGSGGYPQAFTNSTILFNNIDWLR